MANHSLNYNLIKPSETDFYDINDFNQNTDTIDDELKRINTTLDKKVNAIVGKGLSECDYTNAEKSKLGGIADGANKYAHPITHPPSIIVQDANNRFVSDAEKTTWNSHNHTIANVSGLQSALDAKSATTHTHNYAGSSSAGGAATTALVCSGNSATATKATQDATGQQINTTYIKNLIASGKTVTFTRGDGTTGTFSTQDTDTIYNHPNSGVTAGTYKSVTVNAQGHVTAGTNPNTLAGYGITDAAPKSHVGSGGAVHPVVSQSANGFMGSVDKTKLDGIAVNANNYTHPTTSGNKHIPSGGSAGQILRWTSDGTAVWGVDNNTTYMPATVSASGLMSSTDKTKLDGIQNNYLNLNGGSKMAGNLMFNGDLSFGVGESSDGFSLVIGQPYDSEGSENSGHTIITNDCKMKNNLDVSGDIYSPYISGNFCGTLNGKELVIQSTAPSTTSLPTNSLWFW